jgi:hypothetical protein
MRQLKSFAQSFKMTGELMTDEEQDAMLVTASDVVMSSNEEILQTIKDQVLALSFDFVETYGKKPTREWIKLTTTRLYRSYYKKEITRIKSV